MQVLQTPTRFGAVTDDGATVPKHLNAYLPYISPASAVAEVSNGLYVTWQGGTAASFRALHCNSPAEIQTTEENVTDMIPIG
jgi:hypothetical protein